MKRLPCHDRKGVKSKIITIFIYIYILFIKKYSSSSSITIIKINNLGVYLTNVNIVPACRLKHAYNKAQ